MITNKIGKQVHNQYENFMVLITQTTIEPDKELFDLYCKHETYIKEAVASWTEINEIVSGWINGADFIKDFVAKCVEKAQPYLIDDLI